MGRKNHYWNPGTREDDGTLTSRCRNCDLVNREGWYEHEGQVYMVEQWWTPGGALLKIRPLAYVDAPKTAPPLDGAFPGIEVGGVPECPKSPEGWHS